MLKKHPLYIAMIDEIDPHAPAHERKAKRFASLASLVPGYIAFIIVAPFFWGIPAMLNSMMSDKDQSLIKFFSFIGSLITHPNRMLWYYVFFWPAKLILSLTNK